ncbi:uncharacterized protein LOC134217084 isoform X2 [Armigeres subalbatus]|uniref:uncharacterized protein LOC134217084 isoform X2 n=1 Tax=Armigeres subalbatus TaxID=124917 RepID=UPI002ED47EBA
MKVNIVLCGVVLGLVGLVSQTKAGSIQISAYGNATSNKDVPRNDTASKSAGTGRAMGGGSYQNPLQGMLSQAVNFKTSSYRDSRKTPKYIAYPSPMQTVYSYGPSNNVAMDRFAPGEAYGGTVFKIVKAREQKIKNGYQYQKPSATFDDSSSNKPSSPPSSSAPADMAAPISPPSPPSMIVAPTPSPAMSAAPASAPASTAPGTAPSDPSPSNQYIPPSDLNLFAPNLHSHYPPKESDDIRFSGISSYLPPASGTPDSPPADDASPPSAPPASSPPSNQYIPPEGLFQFPPNIHSHYHPPPSEDTMQYSGISSYLPPPAGPSDSYLPPSPGDSAPPSDSADMIGAIPIGPDSPYPSYLPPSPPKPPPMMASMNAMMPSPPQPPPSPPSAPKEIPFDYHGYESYYPHDHDHDHDHDHYHDHDHDHYFHDHEYIFDHDHDHHHIELITTTPAPPPPANTGTARVKNYSYYYLSRTLWYVPLYFTVYFTFYILILILRSIARHKVNYPNQWTGRALQDMQSVTNDQAVQKADVMTTFVMKQIDEFKEKYL